MRISDWSSDVCSSDLSIYDAGFDASWEIDLWGGTRRAIESAEARADAAEEARRAVVMQVIGEVVRSYIDLRTAQALKANAAHDARAHAEIARLIADRLRVGLASRGIGQPAGRERVSQEV